MLNQTRIFVHYLVAIQFIGFSLFSCSSGPPAPKPWFTEHLKILDGEIPPGVDIHLVQDYSNKSVDVTDLLVITNVSSTPLLFATVPPPEELSASFEELCPNGNQCLKLVSGAAWRWGTDLESPYEYGWRPLDFFDQSNPLELYITGRSLGNGEHIVVWFDSMNQFSIGALDRPEEVTIPTSQIIELPFIYGTEEGGIRLLVSYTLNESYPENGGSTSVYCIGGILFLVIGVLLIIGLSFNKLLGYVEKRHRSSNKM